MSKTRRQQIGMCDSSCILQKPTGMATNGGCRCLPRGGVWTKDEQAGVRRLVMLIGQELRALWTREKLLDDVAEAARLADDYDWSDLEAADSTGELMAVISGIVDASKALTKHDKEAQHGQG